jgi:hypothetical protein
MRRPDGIYQSQSASNNQLFTFEIDNSESFSDVSEFLQAKKQMLKFIIKEQITFQGAIKSNLYLECEMINAVQLCNYITANFALYHASDINKHLKASFAKIIREIEECASKESGWSLQEIKALELRTNKFVALRGSLHLRLPDVIRKTEAIITVQNLDNECFKWSVLASIAKNQPQYVEILTKYEDRYKWDMIDFIGNTRFQFVDTFRFMNKPLETLSKILPMEKKVLTGKFSQLEYLSLVTRKGVFPYDYVDSVEKLYERVLPLQASFYNRLNEWAVSDED